MDVFNNMDIFYPVLLSADNTIGTEEGRIMRMDNTVSGIKKIHITGKLGRKTNGNAVKMHSSNVWNISKGNRESGKFFK